MDDLRVRFGRLVAAHRKRCRLTQEALAEAADLSLNMIAKIEAGTTGARFGVIERLADALGVDPAELFTSEIPAGAINRRTFNDITTQLATLPEADLAWVRELLKAALKPGLGRAAKRAQVVKRPGTKKKPARRKFSQRSRSSR